MSCKLTVDSLTQKEKEKINDELVIKLETNKYAMGSAPKYVIPYNMVNDDIYIPFSYSYKVLKKQRPSRDIFSKTSIEFVGDMRPEQQEVIDEAIPIISKNGCIIFSMYMGFGKTACATYICKKINMKVIIITHKIVLMKQWEKNFNKFCPNSKVQILTTKSVMNKECDFYIMNAINIFKMGRKYFEDIGCVVVDEAHLIMAETLSKSLQVLSPRYLIGLTATPYRPDGLDILLEFYFGKVKIIRKLYRKHTAYKVSTDFTPTVELQNNGKVNWNSVLESQASSKERNELIIRLVRYFKERTFLILVKRVAQGQYLLDRFREEGENVTSLLGKQQEFEVTSRILVGTCSKVGVGFDHPKLDTLLLAADVEEYFVQYLGRVFRTKEVEPIIFDLVDKNRILDKHFRTRQAIYLEHGGIVKKFDMKVLEEDKSKFI